MREPVVAANDLLDTLEALDFPAIALTPSTAEIARMNTAARQLLGGEDWLLRVHPRDRALLEEACATLAPRAEFRATNDNLKFRRVQIELRRRGSITIGVLIESVSQASSESALEALLDALPFEVWERDAQGVLIRQNALCMKNFHLRLGSHVEESPVDEPTIRLWRELNARAMGGEVVSYPIDYVIGSKQVHYVNMVAPVRDRDRICGILGVNLDVTATREAERKLSASLEDLAQTQSKLVRRERLAALGELAAIVAHEVRNPLAAIYNSLSTLKHKLTLDHDASVLFGIIEEEAERLNRTVSDLLSYVKPLEPDRRPDDVAELARDVVRQTVTEATIEAKVVADRSVSPISVDPVLMRVALSNLVTNAVQSMPRGGKITVTLRAVGDAVEIAIHDTGRGIPPGVLPRVFEPFFTTRASGAGLGLAVVRRIVEAHDGSVTAESDEKRGTVFTVTLPK